MRQIYNNYNKFPGERLSRGFTLIELLVVIAIIGVLSAIVLTQLSSARNKAADSSIKTNLYNMRSRAESLYDNPSSGYSGVCLDNNITSMKSAAESSSGTTGTCRSGNTYWVAFVTLKTNTALAWCVDYLGNSKSIPSNTGAVLNCP